MGFFSQSPKYDYSLPPGFENEAQQSMQGLLNFDPWAYQPSLGRAGKVYKQSLDQFFGNKKKGIAAGDPSQNILTTAPLAALSASYGTQSRNLLPRALASGDAGLANSGLLNAQAAEMKRTMGQDYGADATRVVAGAQNQALGGYQGALNDKRGFGLQAAGIKSNALQAGNPKNYLVTPTGYSGGGGGALIGGLAGFALGGPAGASLGSQIGGSFNKTAAPGGGGSGQPPQRSGEEGFGGLLANYSGLFGKKKKPPVASEENAGDGLMNFNGFAGGWGNNQPSYA